MLKCTGVPTKEDILEVLPPIERLKKGPVAIIECFEKIPCNPCYTYCPKNAIKEMTNIIERPILDYDKCNGCGMCQAACPGLAIFVVDLSYSENKALVKIPYEFLPMPTEGETLDAIDREGKKVGMCEVLKIQRFKNNEKTPLISIAIDKELAINVRNIRRG